MKTMRFPRRTALIGVLAIMLPVSAQAQEGRHVEGAQPVVRSDSAPRDGSRDFDFEFGSWRANLKRLMDPLTGSDEWVEYEGLSVVRRIWDGQANLGELDVEGPSGRIRGLTLRLYDPEADQWHIRWANARDGLMGEPMIGGFEEGRGVFYNQEMFRGRAVLVRFVFSDITETTFRFEQAFSDDGGRTWEPNWLATFTRMPDG